MKHILVVFLFVCFCGCSSSKNKKRCKLDWGLCGKNLSEIEVIYGKPRSVKLVVSNAYDMDENSQFYPVKLVRMEGFDLVLNQFDVVIWVGHDIPFSEYTRSKSNEIMKKSRAVQHAIDAE